MDWGALRGASVRATVLTNVSVELNGRGGCEIGQVFLENHATFLTKVLIILVGDRVRCAQPG